MYDVSLGWREYKTTFNEHEVSMEVRTLTVKEMMALTPFLKSMDTTELLKAVDVFAPISREAVRNIKGLAVNGQPATPEVISEEAFFTTLLVSIMTHLINISNVGAGAKKKSSSPSGISQSEELSGQEK